MVPLTTLQATSDARTFASGRKSAAIVVVKLRPGTKATTAFRTNPDDLDRLAAGLHHLVFFGREPGANEASDHVGAAPMSGHKQLPSADLLASISRARRCYRRRAFSAVSAALSAAVVGLPSFQRHAPRNPQSGASAPRHARKPSLSRGHRAVRRLTVHHGADALRQAPTGGERGTSVSAPRGASVSV